MSETWEALPEVSHEPTRLSPDDAFALLGNETRFDILRALWEATDPHELIDEADESPSHGMGDSHLAIDAVPFSELYNRVEYGDTGNFSYHLEKLLGHFVRRTDEGYELTESGFAVARSMLVGSDLERSTRGSTPTTADCPGCAHSLEMTYDAPALWLECDGCEGYWPGEEGMLFRFHLERPGLRNRTPRECLDAGVVNAVNRFDSAASGVCPECTGRVHASLSVCDDHELVDGCCDTCGGCWLGSLTYVCYDCKTTIQAPSWAPLLRHPALVSFYYERGIEHVPDSWDAICRCIHWREERHSLDPPRLRVVVLHEGDELRATIDETGTVVDVDRS